MRFKVVFTTIGVLYILLASWMLLQGVGVMRDFAVPERIVQSPVFADFFSFFYQFMAALGLFTIVLGHVTREPRLQRVVSALFCIYNVLVMLRDLSTSDSPLGNHLYRGAGTLIPVFLSASFALASAWLTVSRSR